MPTIAIIRKLGVNPSNGRIAKADKEDIRRRIAIVSRVDRPALLDFFLGGDTANNVGGFFSLTPAAASEVKNPANILLGDIDFWAVPEGDLGRKGEATQSQAESIRLWVSKHLVGNGVIQSDEIAVVYLK